ncbi:hypothetical protein [Leeuwenhoekiella marinoflava]|uniref:Uncharacterized protein n=2 Tax=Leeuwenhoekiella marinoflava TaxID=988 RepID=A0A4Q0PNQ6_9FLAO|nr:hypothetical protein [Leeuwenhoekiella marinoflava]RXG32081.1 hypothetical protein DSL99_1388 [Leeuwenhoekiella marinoflava]SHE97335.1 hypothetical protein SAMN02745246_01443 [Leeuwenhoekiella marinoflava DSM 3653]
MRNILLLAVCIFSLNAFSQKTYLQVDKLVDTKNGKILEEKTIVVIADSIQEI